MLCALWVTINCLLDIKAHASPSGVTRGQATGAAGFANRCKMRLFAAPQRFSAFVAKTQQSRPHGSTYKFLQNVLAKQGGISHTLQLRVDRSVFPITFTGDSIMAVKKKSKGKKPAPK